ncbi:hypothetical protein KEM54_006134 [Ascosphaera aggregata]|nr:hypothetical protein KEM54_006134 [Ascosphaera aggregata]
MNVDNASSGEAVEPLFKSVKKKFIRKKPVEEFTSQDGTPTAAERNAISNPDATGKSSDEKPDHVASEDAQREEDILAEILRRKALNRRKALGIEFTPESGFAEHTRSNSSSEVARPAGEDGQKVQAIAGRFVAHTGQEVDVDEHMMLYIESELAKRRHGPEGQSSDSKGAKPSTVASSTTSQPPHMAPRQAATLGKLHEVDLGPATKHDNITRTEAAARRLAGSNPASVESNDSSSTRKGGKNWRGAKRRTSEDIRRDQLVEEVLRESRLDVYDEPETTAHREDDLAADDRIAEQFRREFMDAIHSRRRRARKQTRGGSGKRTEPSRGPKLGGSRSARAAMRQKEAKQQK